MRSRLWILTLAVALGLGLTIGCGGDDADKAAPGTPAKTPAKPAATPAMDAGDAADEGGDVTYVCAQPGCTKTKVLGMDADPPS